MPMFDPSSHSSFTHDSIDSLGYDWERIANPDIQPKYPFKAYLPRTTEDVVQAVRECAQLGQKLSVRSMGHSSNDLVLNEHGNVLCIQKLNSIVEIDEAARTVVVQSGVVLAQLDDALRPHGLGLPVIGDHNHITAGGFASVGGISPASHKQGMFIDNVLELEYVSWDGQLGSCSRATPGDMFFRLLAGTGRFGVITKLKLRLLKIDKYTTVLENERQLFGSVNKFLKVTEGHIRNPGEDVRMERGLWVDFPIGKYSLKVGQFSQYRETSQNPIKTLRQTIAYDYLHGLGYPSGRLPYRLEVALKYIGIAGIVLSPRYATTKNIEGFTDRILDESVGDPARMLIALAPTENYSKLFRALYQRCLGCRAEHDALTFISVYVKAIRSDYLADGVSGKTHCELMLFLGMNPARMTDAILAELVSDIDNLCIANGALRYMHSKTSKDARRALIDPNEVRAAQGRPASAVAKSEPPAATASAAGST
jgi:FAD binding domain